MSEHDRISAAEDPADPTERRDWDLPAELHREQPSEHPPDADDAEVAAAFRARQVPDARETVGGSRHREPADESEKRDWDVP